MRRDKQFFNINNWMFWIILSVILFLALPFFKNGFYDEERTQEWVKLFEKRKIDSTQRPKKDSSLIKNDSTAIAKDEKKIIWSWRDYNGNSYEISFFVPNAQFVSATGKRVNYQYSGEAKLYYDFIQFSDVAIDSMVTAMQKDMKEKSIVGMDQLHYVVTAIQTPEYTKITRGNECPCFDMGQNWVNDCNARDDGKGCCNNVIPIGVYSPAEFIEKKTGDCDTKALIAYAILKKLNFDAALILGDVEGGRHAMLAVANVIPVVRDHAVKHNGILYFPWEVTSFDSRCQLGSTSMWRIWKNWEVCCD
jgi:hypothetical protein